jgi:hypothetical protein
VALNLSGGEYLPGPSPVGLPALLRRHERRRRRSSLAQA